MGMSYCRMGKDSDLYVLHAGYGFECVNCKLQPKYQGYGMHMSTVRKTRKQMIKHINQHIEAGHKVPERAISRLNNEIRNEY